jgi:hypothetical protein
MDYIREIQAGDVHAFALQLAGKHYGHVGASGERHGFADARAVVEAAGRKRMVRASGFARLRGVSGAGKLCVCDDESRLRDDCRQAAKFAGGCEVFRIVDRADDRYYL